MTKIFRDSAISAQSGRFYGEASISHQRAPTFFLLLSILFFMAIFFVGLNIEFTSGYVSAGHLSVTEGLITIRSPADGVIKEIKTSMGALENKGDRLFVVDSSTSSPHSASFKSNISNIKTEIVILTAQKKLLEDERAMIKVSLTEQISAPLEESKALSRIRENSNKILLFAKSEQDAVEAMEKKNYTSKIDVFRLRQSVLQKENNMHNIGVEINKVKDRMGALEYSRNLELKGYELQILKVDHDLLNATSKLQAELALENFAINTPVSGQVTNISVIAGEFISKGDQLAAIRTGSDNLRVFTNVPADIARFIRAGLFIKGRIDDLSLKKLGSLRCIVEEIDRSPISLDASGLNVGYKVVLSFDSVSQTRLRSHSNIADGLTVHVVFPTETSSIYDWISATFNNL